MDDDTLTALHGSIAKWQAIYDGTGEDQGSDNCPLCQMFFEETSSCKGCPVQGATGQEACEETPYWATIKAAKDFGPYSPEYKAAAKQELEFLKSLLPKEP